MRGHELLTNICPSYLVCCQRVELVKVKYFRKVSFNIICGRGEKIETTMKIRKSLIKKILGPFIREKVDEILRKPLNDAKLKLMHSN